MEKKDKLRFSILFAVSVLYDLLVSNFDYLSLIPASACMSAIPRLYWSVVLMQRVDVTFTITWQGLWVWAEFGFGYAFETIPFSSL